MRKKLGVVGVDSGQLMICDPCYIGSQWKDEKFQDIRIYEDVSTKTRYKYRENFEHFDSKIDGYIDDNGELMTPNQLIKKKTWVRVDEDKSEHNFSYNACCKATSGKKLGGQLNYIIGHEGVAVAFRSGLGDGTYEVFAEIEEIKIKDDNGREINFGERIVKVEIILMEDANN